MYYSQFSSKYNEDNDTQGEKPLSQIGDNDPHGKEQLITDLADIFRAVSDPTRLKILYLVALNDPEDVTGARISKLLHISPPTVTHHMNKLEEAGFITRVRHGRRARYEVCTEIYSHFNVLVRVLTQSLH